MRYAATVLTTYYSYIYDMVITFGVRIPTFSHDQYTRLSTYTMCLTYTVL